MSSGEELHEYIGFAGRQRRDTALHTLEGFLEGVRMDHVINLQEHRELTDWIHGHERLAEKELTFRELLMTLKSAISDGRLEPHEIADLSALCQRAKSNSIFYDAITHAVQELHGILHGVVADVVINEEELRGIQQWIEDHSDLRGVWPVTEIEAVIVKVLVDKRIDEAEQRMMLRYFSEFVPNPNLQKKLPPLLPAELSIKGVCAVDPEISFDQKIFCFTGISSKGPRRLFSDKVTEKGGVFTENIRNDLDYLIIGDEGNPCWAFTCYGRKVELAVEMRRRGHRVLLLHERDFWDAVV